MGTGEVREGRSIRPESRAPGTEMAKGRGEGRENTVESSRKAAWRRSESSQKGGFQSLLTEEFGWNEITSLGGGG